MRGWKKMLRHSEDERQCSSVLCGSCICVGEYSLQNIDCSLCVLFAEPIHCGSWRACTVSFVLVSKLYVCVCSLQGV